MAELFHSAYASAARRGITRAHLASLPIQFIGGHHQECVGLRQSDDIARSLATAGRTLRASLHASAHAPAGSGSIRCARHSACASRARKIGSGRGAAPPSRSIAGTTNSSNVTIVETGLPGKPNTGLPPHTPKTAGLPGRMATASNTNFAPNSAEDQLHQIVLPHRDAAGHDQQIRFQAALDRGGAAPFFRPARCPAESAFGARQPSQRFERDAIAIANLERPGRRGDVDHLIARRENGDARTLENAATCVHAHLRRPKPSPA